MSAFPQDGSYPAVHNLIMSTCHQFRRKRAEIRRKRIDWEDVLQEAHLAYWIAKASFRERYGVKFSTWVRTKVYGRLLDMAEREDRTIYVGYDYDYPAQNRLSWNADDWMEGLGEDARNVAILALGPIRSLTTSDSPKFQREAIRRFLHGLGWSRKRIQSAILEIKESLT